MTDPAPQGDGPCAPAPEPGRGDAEHAAELLDQAEAALEDPPRAETAGMAAFAMLSRTEADAGGRNVDLLLRAAWTVLRSRCVTGRLAAAADAYQVALPFLAAAPPISGGRATLLFGVARLRWSQGRLDEAAALFAHAATIFCAATDHQGHALCRALGGFVYAEQRDPSRAAAELASAPLDLDLAPALAVRALLLHAWCHLRVGHVGAGRDLLHEARASYGRISGAGEETIRAWWEAQIAFLDGQPGRALEGLDAVRRRLLAEGSFLEAVRASLDLLALRVEAGRLDGVSDLAPDLLNAHPGQRWALTPAVAIDWLAMLAAQQSVRFEPASVALRHHLSTLRRSPLDRPDLIADVRDLADHLLVGARRQDLLRRAAAEESAPAPVNPPSGCRTAAHLPR